MFITFLGHGMVCTPRIMDFPGIGPTLGPDNGESGRVLEVRLLGGYSQLKPDRRLRDDHVSEQPRLVYIKKLRF